MESIFNDVSPWFVALIVSRILCGMVLTALLVDSVLVGQFVQCLRLVVVPFVVGVVILEIADWKVYYDQLLLWLCATSSYYVSIRLCRNTSVDPRSPVTLAKSFILMWTIYSLLVGLILVLVSPYVLVKLVERFAEWVAVTFTAYVVGKYLQQHPKMLPYGAIAIGAGIAALVIHYHFEGSGMWSYYWQLFK
jgi:hypothetical protein